MEKKMFIVYLDKKLFISIEAARADVWRDNVTKGESVVFKDAQGQVIACFRMENIHGWAERNVSREGSTFFQIS